MSTFLPIFGEKLAFFSKTNVNYLIFAKTSNSRLSQKTPLFAKFLGENIIQ
jgi:hypothetical protein